jgi:hypothetical protein
VRVIFQFQIFLYLKQELKCKMKNLNKSKIKKSFKSKAGGQTGYIIMGGVCDGVLHAHKQRVGPSHLGLVAIFIACNNEG